MLSKNLWNPHKSVIKQLFTKSSQIISTRLLTVLTKSVLTHIEQKKQIKKMLLKVPITLLMVLYKGGNDYVDA